MEKKKTEKDEPVEKLLKDKISQLEITAKEEEKQEKKFALIQKSKQKNFNNSLQLLSVILKPHQKKKYNI